MNLAIGHKARETWTHVNLTYVSLVCGLAVAITAFASSEDATVQGSLTSDAQTRQQESLTARSYVLGTPGQVGFTYYIVSSEEQARSLEADLYQGNSLADVIGQEVVVADTAEARHAVHLLLSEGSREVMQQGMFLNVIDLR